MPNSYVKESERKHKYVARACTYYVKRMSEPIQDNYEEYKSIRKMSLELGIPDGKLRKFFFKSPNETEYVKSTTTGTLYLLKKGKREIVCSARCVDDVEDESIIYQTFTSYYQLVKRFKISSQTIRDLRKVTPLRQETTKTVFDEFKRRFVLTFYK